jgi:hypothetical protein
VNAKLLRETNGAACGERAAINVSVEIEREEEREGRAEDVPMYVQLIESWVFCPR